MKSDNWEHRSSKMRCETCMWFVPTMNGFPAVFVDDWCGDHKLNENTC